MYSLLYIIIIIFFLSIFMILINFFFSTKKKNNREKSSPYECGFDPLNSSRLPFSIQFYLISIIFLIFDIEIIIFFPMIKSFLFTKFTFWFETSMIFILILLIGLYIEWKNGALTWLK